MHQKLVLVVVICGLSTAAQLASQAVADPAADSAVSVLQAPPVEALVAKALANSPGIQALRAKLAAAREMERPAGALPDPMVGAMIQDASFPKNTIGQEPMSMAGFEVRQDLLFPGKRSARVTVALAETAQRDAELAALEAQTASDIRTLFARIYALDREQETASAAHELLSLLSATVAARYAAGEAQQEALVRVQIEISRLNERLDDLSTERIGWVAALNRWLDQPADAPLGTVASLPTVEHRQPFVRSPDAETSPEVLTASAALATAASRSRVAQTELKPNLSSAAGIGFRGSKDPVVTLRFGFELPIWRRQKQEPMARAAAHEVVMAQSELRSAQAMVRAESARLEAQWTTSERQIVRYKEGILPQSSLALDAARSAYLAGRGDFETVIADFNLWLEARMELARRESDRFIAWAELQRLAQPARPQASEASR